MATVGVAGVVDVAVEQASGWKATSLVVDDGLRGDDGGGDDVEELTEDAVDDEVDEDF